MSEHPETVDSVESDDSSVEHALRVGLEEFELDDADRSLLERAAEGVDGDLGLLGHPQVDATRVDLPAPGVHQGEPAAGPLGVVRDAVTGDPGDVLDDGLTAADDAVDERGLADVGPPHDRDDGQRPVGDRIAVLVVLTVDEGAVLLT